eukprot:237285-Rhodomonas_salina.1
MNSAPAENSDPTDGGENAVGESEQQREEEEDTRLQEFLEEQYSQITRKAKDATLDGAGLPPLLLECAARAASQHQSLPLALSCRQRSAGRVMM